MQCFFKGSKWNDPNSWVEKKMPDNNDEIEFDKAPWVVVFECGHSQLPNVLNVTVSPEIGWAGRCNQCSDYRKTVKIIRPGDTIKEKKNG